MGHLRWEGVTCLCLNGVVVVEALVHRRDRGKAFPYQSNASPPDVIISTEQHGISLGWSGLSDSQPQTPSQQELWFQRRQTFRILDNLMANALTPTVYWYYCLSAIFYFGAACHVLNAEHNPLYHYGGFQSCLQVATNNNFCCLLICWLFQFDN